MIFPSLDRPGDAYTSAKRARNACNSVAAGGMCRPIRTCCLRSSPGTTRWRSWVCGFLDPQQIIGKPRTALAMDPPDARDRDDRRGRLAAIDDALSLDMRTSLPLQIALLLVLRVVVL